jgi:hypothetical protein
MGLDQYIFKTYEPVFSIINNDEDYDRLERIVNDCFSVYHNDPESHFVISTKDWCYFSKGHAIAAFLLPYSCYVKNAYDYTRIISLNNMTLLYEKCLLFIDVINKYFKHKGNDITIDYIYNNFKNGWKFSCEMGETYKNSDFVSDLKNVIFLNSNDEDANEVHEICWWNLPYYFDLAIYLHHYLIVKPELKYKDGNPISLFYIEG